MRRYRFRHVDVFTTTPLGGNPAAVFLDAEGLTDAEMQAIAREMNLSETTFVLPPTARDVADYRLRIFTPRRELPFAGHPTIGTVAVLTEAGRVRGPVVRQECGAGIVDVAVEETGDARTYWIAMPDAAWTAPALTRTECATLLGCADADVADGPPAVVAPGIPWVIVRVRSWQVVRAARPDLARIETVAARLAATGVTVFALDAEDPGCRVRLRSFPPGEGIAEDPVCGSGNGAVAGYIAHEDLLGADAFTYVAEQGAEISRAGRVHVRARRDVEGRWHVSVGGQAVVVVDAELTLG
jgi:PhzF family phenazine biosynthesis protein